MVSEGDGGLEKIGRTEKDLELIARRSRAWGEMESAGGDEGLGEIGREGIALVLEVCQCCVGGKTEAAGGE